MSESPKPKIGYGFRNEGLHYEIGGKKAEFEFTWVNGQRIHTESISRWHDGTLIADNEKKRILQDLLKFTKGWFRRSIVVINTDDPSRSLFEEVCSEVLSLVKGIEYTSDEKNEQFERQMYLDILYSKAGLMIDGIQINSEQELDEVLAKIRGTRQARTSASRKDDKE